MQSFGSGSSTNPIRNMQTTPSDTDATFSFSEAELSELSPTEAALLCPQTSEDLKDLRPLLEERSFVHLEDAILTMRDYQKEGIDRLINSKRIGLFDEMGLGKTPQTILSLRRSKVRSCMVICPSRVIRVWEDEVAKWWPQAKCYVSEGPERSAAAGRKRFLAGATSGKEECSFLITTYTSAQKVKMRGWQAIVFDEAHKLTNRKTQLFRWAARQESDFLFLLTGTPSRKSAEQLWNYLHLIDPDKFRSFWKWTKTYLHIMKGQFGTEILGPKDPEVFRAHLAPYFIQRLKNDVRKDLPEKLPPQKVVVEVDSRVAKLYDQLVEELIAEHESGVLLLPNRLALTTRLRQLTICPKVLGFDLPSSLIETTTDIAEEAYHIGDSSVIFVPFKDVIPEIEGSLRARGIPSYSIHGGMKRKDTDEVLQRFQNCSGPAALIATTSLGVGWSATKANVNIFCGLDWDRINCLQSEDRTHRHGQTKVVSTYYVMSNLPIDRSQLDALNMKHRVNNIIFNPKQLLRSDRKAK